jgi:hypothetical protein|tara:strand:+ start:496 stop:996 length:501 start_codon:yes stop_codon:yes gene_type:complete
MIKEIQIKVPEESLLECIKILRDSHIWKFAYDNDEDYDGWGIDKANMGLHSDRVTDELRPYVILFGDLIFKEFKFKSIKRVIWNYYDRDSSCLFHKDFPKENNLVTSIINLNNNDGGTEIRFDNGDLKFLPSTVNKIYLFDSKLDHRGMGPKKYYNRFSLAFVLNN